MGSVRCAIIPPGKGYHSHVEPAAVAAGAELVDPLEAEAIIWTDPYGPGELPEILAKNPNVRWVQLPFAGIEPFIHFLDRDRLWTCAKGVFAEPVAEHALGMAIAGMRGSIHYARQTTWSAPVGRRLTNGKVTILGGGGITESLVRMLTPFNVTITVVRKRSEAMDGVHKIVSTEHLHDAVADADLVFVALALTGETRHIIDAAALDAMPDHTWIVNVARGGHIDSEALIAALDAGTIGGACLDVTDPEPLPDGHPLWSYDNVLITPHIANTPEMGRELLAERVAENVRRFAAGKELLGPVDVEMGY